MTEQDIGDGNERFTHGEASLLVDAFNGTIFSIDPRTQLLMGVEDSIRLDGLDGKWEVDAERLIAKLRRMSPSTAAEVVAGVQRFWTEAEVHAFDEALERSRLTTMPLIQEEGTGGQPPLWEPHESRNAVDRAVAADSFTTAEAVRWLRDPDQQVRDYARGKLPNIRHEGDDPVE